MFGFIDRVAQKAKQTMDSFLHKRPPIIPSEGAGDRDVRTHGLADAIGKVEAIRDVMQQGNFGGVIARESAEWAEDKLREMVEPISRTDELKDSFSVRTSWDESSVVTDSDYAEAIDEGLDAVPPPVAALLEWMKSKPELSGYTGKEARRVAFAIQISIRKQIESGNYKPSPRSTIMQLPPVGERRYNYIEQTKQEARGSMRDIGRSIARLFGGR